MTDVRQCVKNEGKYILGTLVEAIENKNNKQTLLDVDEVNIVYV